MALVCPRARFRRGSLVFSCSVFGRDRSSLVMPRLIAARLCGRRASLTCDGGGAGRGPRRGPRRQGWAASHQAALAKARGAIVSDDHMVEEREADERPDFREALGEGDVLSAGSGVG